MSQSPTQPSGAPGAAPTPSAAPAPGGAPARKPAQQQQRPKQVGPTIDPVRVLRQHAWLLGGAAMVGAVMGVVVNYAQLFLYPVWSGSAVFEVAPEIKDATSVLSTDNTLEETVARVGQTESRRMISKRVLEAAMKRPDIATTEWGKDNPTVDERVEKLEKTLRVITSAAHPLLPQLEHASQRGHPGGAERLRQHVHGAAAQWRGRARPQEPGRVRDQA